LRRERFNDDRIMHEETYGDGEGVFWAHSLAAEIHSTDSFGV